MVIPALSVRIPASLALAGMSGGPEGDLAIFCRAIQTAGAGGLFIGDVGGSGRVRGGAPRGCDPFAVLGAIASVVPDVVLGCLAVPIAGRPPSMLAKVVTGLDVLSGGRALLAVEHRSMDDPSDAASQRFTEALEVIRAMLRLPAPSMNAQHFRVQEAWNEPRSNVELPVPIGVLAQVGPNQNERSDVLAAAARFADLCVIESEIPFHELSPTLASLRSLAARAGRLPGMLRIGALLDLDDLVAGTTARAIKASGFDSVVLDWSAESLAAAYASALVGELESDFRTS